MDARTKKKIGNLPNSSLIGLEVEAICRDSNDKHTAVIVEATNKQIVASFDKGKFGSTVKKFRRDTATQMGGPLRLNLESVAG